MSKYYAPIISAILVLFIGIFIGKFVDIYGRLPIFDKVMHFSGGFVSGWIFLLFVRDELRRSSFIKRILVVMGGVALIGIFWEFAEYLSSALHYYFPVVNEYLYIGSLRDTMLDIVTDLSGGLLGFFVFFRKNK
jgi:hypothetical protein